jgi:aspartate/methionine/tyrosine aminotransferase
LQTVLDAFVNRGDRVVLLDPCSPLYPLLIRTRQARVQWLSTWMDNGRTHFRLDHLARALRGARLLILNSPANPTGGIIAAEDLEQIAWWAERHDTLLLSDESFERYHFDGAAASMAAMAGARNRTLTVGSVSKGYALASARVGWLAAPRGLLRPCRLTAALRSPFVATLSQQVALAALRSDPGDFEPIRAELESRRRYVFERLRGMDLNPAWPAGGFFFWIPVWDKGFSGRRFAEELMQQYQVCVSPGDLYGPSGTGYMRISYALDEGRVQEGLNRLSDYLLLSQGSEASAKRPLAA